MVERTDEREVSEAENLLDGSGSGDVDLSGRDCDGGDVGLDDDELGVDVDALTSDPATGAGSPPSAEAESGPKLGLRERLRPDLGLGRRVRSPFPSVPSARSVGVSFVVTVAFMLVVGSLVPLPASGLLGVFAGAFALGVASGEQRYLELVVSGAAAAGLSMVVGSLTLAALAGLAVPLAAFGASGGVLAALLGHYFGRDLRDGLMRDV
jgi:hypothetical protein